MSPSLCHYNAKLSKTAVHLQRVSSSCTLRCPDRDALLFMYILSQKGKFIQEGALEDSLHNSTLLEGFGRCSHVEHSVRRSYTWPNTAQNDPPQQ